MMRRILPRLLLLFLLLFLCLSGIQDSRVPDPLTLLARELPDWSNQQKLGSLVKKVQGRLPVYYHWRDQAQTMAADQDFYLTIIGQTHMSEMMVPAWRRNVLISQRNVFSFLTQLHPDMVGNEGWSNDTLNATAYLSKFKAKPRAKILAEEGAIRYLYQHRRVAAIGADDADLLDLNLLIWSLIHQQNIETASGLARLTALDRLNNIVIDARSQLAIDRTVIGLGHRQLRRAALVIGRTHKDVCLEEVMRLGIESSYYQASPYRLAK